MDRTNTMLLLTDAELIDAAGRAKAETARARAEETELLDELKRRYPGGASLSGDLFDATVSSTQGRESWDSEWLRSHLHPNQIRHALRRGADFLVVKIVARRRK